MLSGETVAGFSCCAEYPQLSSSGFCCFVSAIVHTYVVFMYELFSFLLYVSNDDLGTKSLSSRTPICHICYISLKLLVAEVFV